MNHKALVLLFVVLFLGTIALTFASPLTMTVEPEDFKYSSEPTFKGTMSVSENSMCPLCVNVMGQTISQLLNIILNGGVIGTCSKLCGMLKQGPVITTACNLICDIVGIKEFIKLVKKADLNPIWLCQMVKACPIRDCTLDKCAEFEQTVVAPEAGRVGTTFVVSSEFTVFEQTGTGEMYFQVQPVGMPPMTLGQLVPEGFQPGTFQIKVNVPIKNNHQADPPVIFRPGVYRGNIAICQGMCGSKHTHTRLLAMTSFSFNVTSN